MKKVVLHPDSCKGCRYCLHFCPKEALSVTEMVNSKGYLPVQVDAHKCITCGLCYIVCPDYVFELLEV